MKAKELLEKAGAQLLFGHPFWATLHYQLQRGRVAVSPDVCQVAATDGKAFLYNPEGIAKLPIGQVKTVIAHEAGHVMLAHHVRMKGKDPELSNIAADHVINNILTESGFEPVTGWLCDPRFKGQTFEQVYQTLEKERPKGGGGGGGQQPPPQGGQQQQGAGGGKGKPKGRPPGGQPQLGQSKGQPQSGQAATTPGGFGQILPCPDEEVTQQEAQWKMAVETAAAAARQAGKLPGHLARLVEEIREAKVDWRELLKTFLANCVPSDFTWSRPSKRTLSQGIYLPSQKKEGLGELVFSIDASGSIGKKELAEFLGEVNTVVQDLKPEKVWLVSHDTVCYELGEYGPGDEIAVDNVKGGGGTDFCCVFDWADTNGVAPRCMVFLTDLCGAFPKHEPSYPVLWVCTTKQIAPFGETARMEV